MPIEEVIGGEAALGESAGADELLEATDTPDPTAPPPEAEPVPEPQVDWAPMLELALASWGTVAATRWPEWEFTEPERQVLAQAWAPVAEKYADGLTMSVEAAAIIATIPILIPRLMGPKAVTVAKAGPESDFPPTDPDPSAWRDPDARTSEPDPADL